MTTSADAGRSGPPDELLAVARERAVTVLEDIGEHGAYRIDLVHKVERLRTLAHGLMSRALTEDAQL